MWVTIYRCQIQAIIKKRKTIEIFKLIYFKKLPIKKVLINDDSVLVKCWFNNQAPQKVLIELSPGVSHEPQYLFFYTDWVDKCI